MKRQAHRHVYNIAALLVCLAVAPVQAGPARSVDRLLADAARLLEENATAAYPGARVEARMQTLDARLDLPPCEEAELKPRGQQHHGRIAVAVRCHAPQPWSIFLTGDVTVSVAVVTTTQPVRRGQIIDPDMLTTAEQDLSELRGLFYTDPADVIGKETRRHLAEAEVVLASRLTEPVAVERGNKVQITSRRGAVEITSFGEALSDGRVGAQVRVRNLDSGRIVHAWVQAPGRVLTSPAALGGH